METFDFSTTTLALLSGAVFILILLSGFFSGSETALTAASKAKLHKLEKNGATRAGLVTQLITDPERLIGAILLGNNLVNIAASVLTTTIFLALVGPEGVFYATILMTALVVIFAEVLPKTYAIKDSERVAMRVAGTIRVVVYLFAPIVITVQWVVEKTLGIITSGGHEDDVLSPEEELRGTIDLQHSEGSVEKEHRDMLGGILDLTDLDVLEVMVHRKNIGMIDAGLPIGEVISQALASPHTRIPLFQEDPENIVGVLHAKDLLRALYDKDGKSKDISILDVAIEPWFIPETTSLQEQLDAFLQKKMHFALIVDEYGALQGLITLEDILEEIVGEITDEHDIDHAGIRPQPNGSLHIDGSVSIRDLNRLMDWTLPDDEATTIAGLIIHEAQTIPDPGQAFNFYDFRFEILRRHRNQITALRITPSKSA
jgi:magnesium and cobalt exporter, CNNM family